MEFSSDFFIIKPKDLTRGNGSVLYEVSNRGNKSMLGFFDFASASTDPQNAQDFGDGFLLEQGFTLLWVGWQFDVPNRDNALRAYLPVAREPDGRPIRGPVEESPLAVCDARSMELRDFVASDLRYRDRTGEVYSVAYNPKHRWFYFLEVAHRSANA